MRISLQNFIKSYFKLTKAGITFFALLSAGAGYLLSLQTSPNLDLPSVPFPFYGLMIGLYLVVSGSFALNQAYEWQKDSLMKRTQKRPVPAGKLTAFQAVALGFFLMILGLFILLALKPLTAGLSLLAVLLYNVFYTMSWKKRWAFSAVPGAIPGALPVLIGWSVASSTVWQAECLYLFFILFLWQMPHFWSLALHYREDYKLAGFPVLPLKAGKNKTLCFMGFYLMAYLGLALLQPLFWTAFAYEHSPYGRGMHFPTKQAVLAVVPFFNQNSYKMNLIYVFLLIFCLKIFWEFIKFSKELKWKPFFMWLNLSVLVFLYAPALQIWFYST